MIRIIVELALVLGGIVFGATQVLWPLITRKPLLPAFRSKAALALHEAEQQKREAALRLGAAQLEAEAEKIRRQTEEVALVDYNKLTEKERT